jgi:hypothetical protein
MNADFGIDLDAIRRVIDGTDVFVIRFGQIDQRLLVDTRQDDNGTPFIKVVPPATSAEERYRYLRQARPGMALPEQITVFQWPQSVKLLKTVGLWKRIEKRFFELGGLTAVHEVGVAFNEAVKLERSDLLAAIRGGEGYETIWEREPNQ